MLQGDNLLGSVTFARSKFANCELKDWKVAGYWLAGPAWKAGAEVNSAAGSIPVPSAYDRCKGSGIDPDSHYRYTSGGHDDWSCQDCNGEGIDMDEEIQEVIDWARFNSFIRQRKKNEEL